MISSPTGINPASAAISDISHATLTPWEIIRSVSATISNGAYPPYLFVTPRFAPLNACDPINVTIPLSSSSSNISSLISRVFSSLNPEW